MVFYHKLIYKTIFHSACESGNLELVKYLISFDGIDITAEDF